MHTKDMMALALREAGLEAMGDKAVMGYYHDFLSPLAMPEAQLLHDLKVELGRRVMESAATPEPEIDAVQKLIDRHMNGEFDASKEESDEWAASEEGRAAFNGFFNGLVESVRK
jgi:hypothetical protein